jgi:hypothetical protein
MTPFFYAAIALAVAFAILAVIIGYIETLK